MSEDDDGSMWRKMLEKGWNKVAGRKRSRGAIAEASPQASPAEDKSAGLPEAVTEPAAVEPSVAVEPASAEEAPVLVELADAEETLGQEAEESAEAVGDGQDAGAEDAEGAEPLPAGDSEGAEPAPAGDSEGAEPAPAGDFIEIEDGDEDEAMEEEAEEEVEEIAGNDEEMGVVAEEALGGDGDQEPEAGAEEVEAQVEAEVEAGEEADAEAEAGAEAEAEAGAEEVVEVGDEAEVEVASAATPGPSVPAVSKARAKWAPPAVPPSKGVATAKKSAGPNLGASCKAAAVAKSKPSPTAPPGGIARPGTGAAPRGYLFLCNNRTLKECESLRLLGSPMPEMSKMTEGIRPDTNIFLLNFETLLMVGPFAAVGAPQKDIVPHAFGKRFGAQVRVAPMDMEVFEAKLERRIPGGPKTAQEVAELNARLLEGEAKPLGSWGSGEEPPAKRQKMDLSSTDDVVDCDDEGVAGGARGAEFHSAMDDLPDGPQSPGAASSTPNPTPPRAKWGGQVPKALSSMSVPPAKGKSVAVSKLGAGSKGGPAKPSTGPAKALTGPAKPWQPAAGGVGGPAKAWQQAAAGQQAAGGAGGPPKAWQQAAVGQQAAGSAGGPAKAWQQAAGGGHNVAGKAGYVFVCNGGSQRDCEQYRLLGSPATDLEQMKRCIKPDTPIFLFNFETYKMYGPLIASSEPKNNILERAWKGRFPSQLQVSPMNGQLREAKMNQRVSGGPKSPAEVQALMNRLQQGFVNTQSGFNSGARHWNGPKALNDQQHGPKGQPWNGPKNGPKPPPGAPPAAWPQNSGGSAPDQQFGALDKEGRRYDLSRVIVNFANVGATYAEKVLGKKHPERLFDWEGVRKCVKCLTEEHKMKVVGVVFENLWGPDNGQKEKNGIPDDIKRMCDSIEETPRITGRNHKSADDEMTIKCAYRRNCRFMDNDNYRDWLTEMHNEKCRVWLENCQELLQMRYFFDSIGFFDTLDGNIPSGLLAPAA
mmetsp:Transcript_94110/g.201981  ORF Transcript_94110/g.201981 Transcript_94110/m.201981 type:complete len:982 (+) Transcript_94110:79-3024(+)